MTSRATTTRRSRSGDTRRSGEARPVVVEDFPRRSEHGRRAAPLTRRASVFAAGEWDASQSVFCGEIRSTKNT